MFNLGELSMKKSLIALAALAATGVYAQSTVTLFGVADVGYRTSKWNNAGAVRAKASGIADGAMAGNRFGFRGTEDLGGGLRASFVIEQGLSLVASDLTNQRQGNSNLPVNGYDGVNGAASTALADSGRTTAVNRQSFLSLSSAAMGEIRAGFQYNNLYELSTLSGFNAGSEGVQGADTAHTVFGGAAWGGARGNGITYISPKLANAVTLRVQRGAGADQEQYVTTGASAGYKQERTSIAVDYTAGPLKAMLAQTSYKTATSASGSTSLGATTTADLTQIGASYNLGVASVMGTYATGDNGAAGTAQVDTKAQQIGVKVPMGSFTLIAATGKGTQKSVAAGTTADVKQSQVGANYSLSKRTTAYIYSGTTKDSGNAATAVDKKSTTIVGVLHTF
jgi:predicted porin